MNIYRTDHRDPFRTIAIPTIPQPLWTANFTCGKRFQQMGALTTDTLVDITKTLISHTLARVSTQYLRNVITRPGRHRPNMPTAEAGPARLWHHTLRQFSIPSS